MAESAAFEAACTCLEESSSLDRLAVRGTIRIALKQAGLESKAVSASQLGVVLEKLLPAELASRGVSAPEELCARIRKALAGLEPGARHDSPDAIFARLGGDSAGRARSGSSSPRSGLAPTAAPRPGGT